jgi:hypothetical protein
VNRGVEIGANSGNRGGARLVRGLDAGGAHTALGPSINSWVFKGLCRIGESTVGPKTLLESNKGRG